MALRKRADHDGCLDVKTIARRERRAATPRGATHTRTRGAGSAATPAARLAGFIDRYTPDVARVARAALRTMRARMPGAVELVYDNYNGLAIGFGPSERSADLVFSVTLYPRWVSLFFVHGVGLPDPDRRLQGSGTRIRSITLESARTLDEPAVRALVNHALSQASLTIDGSRRGRIVIKSVSAKQRPRRPA